MLESIIENQTHVIQLTNFASNIIYWDRFHERICIIKKYSKFKQFLGKIFPPI